MTCSSHPAWPRRGRPLCVSTPPSTYARRIVGVSSWSSPSLRSGCGWHAQPVTDRPVRGLLHELLSGHVRPTGCAGGAPLTESADRTRRHRTSPADLGQTRRAERHHPFSLAVSDAVAERAACAAPIAGSGRGAEDACPLGGGHSVRVDRLPLSVRDVSAAQGRKRSRAETSAAPCSYGVVSVATNV